MPALSSIALGIGAAGALGSGVMGHLANMSAQERAAALQDKGVQEWLKINIPDPEQQKLALEQFVQVGTLTPQLESAVQMAETKMKGVQMDPRLKETRLRALGSLEDIGYGGESSADEAALQNSLIQSGAKSRGRDQAILGSMERRGQLGSGLELSARMDASQAEGDRLASQGLQMETDRRARALNAIMGAGNLAGDMSDDDVRLKSDIAKAHDTIGMFNTQNAQGAMTRNTNRVNDASQYNLGVKQNVSDKNVATNNFQQQYNKELAQKEFDNKAKKAAGVAGQFGQQADQEIANGQSAANMWGSIASGVGSAGMGFAQMADKRKKEEDDWGIGELY